MFKWGTINKSQKKHKQTKYLKQVFVKELQSFVFNLYGT